jgi:hypothetical protein
MSVDTKVQLQSGTISSAQNVRTLEVKIQQADGTLATVELQVVAIADQFGNILRIDQDKDWQQQMLDELRAIRFAAQATYDLLINETSTYDRGANANAQLDVDPIYSNVDIDFLDLAQSCRADEEN